ncbi:MAG: hypothetical protein ACRC2U_20460 [Aeromonas sp.]
MQFFFYDLLGLALGTLIMAVTMIAPGFGLVQLSRKFITIDGEQGLPIGWEWLIGLALLPVVGAIVARFIGLNAFIAICFALAVVGLPPLLRTVRSLSLGQGAIVFAWWLVVAWSYVDFDINGQLYQSLLITDLVKHSAVVHIIATTGVPLSDPFFLRDGIAGYYYYFYLPAAIVDRLGGTLVDSRMAFVATAFSVGLSFPVLWWVIARQCDWIVKGWEQRFFMLCVGLCFVSGLDVPPAIAATFVRGYIDGQIDWWDDEISFALSSVMWVPHHIGAVIGVFAGAMLLAHARTADRSTRNWLIAATGLAFASVFGQSVWVAVGAFAVLLAWILPDLLQRRFNTLIDLAGAGIIALLLSIPQIIDLLAGRNLGDGFLGFWIRSTANIIMYPGLLSDAITLGLLPVAYSLEFGFFLLGGVLFFFYHPARQWLDRPIPRLLLIGLITSLLLNAFVRSTVIGNDFGWRVAWFMQIPLIIWTAVAIQPGGRVWLKRPVIAFVLILGVAANVWSLVGWRLMRPPMFTTSTPFINAQTGIDYESRQAYLWANSNLAADAIVQHNPAQEIRIFNFGLYSQHRVAVADRDARLFGASREDVQIRLKKLKRLFAGGAIASDVVRDARQLSIDYLMVTSTDGMWRNLDSYNETLTCVYRTQHICLLAMGNER